MTAIFADGFEGGNFSAWTGTTTSGSGSANSVISTSPHAGIYCSRHYVAVDSGKAYAYRDFADQTTVYARAYVKIDALPGTLNHEYSLLSMTGGTYFIAKIDVVKNALGVVWSLMNRNNSVNVSHATYTTSLPQADRWYCIELKAVMGAGTGSVTAWVDGVQIYNYTGLNNVDQTSVINNVRVGEGYAGGSTAHNIYVDDAVVSNSYIGIAAPILVSDTLSLLDSTLRHKPFFVVADEIASLEGLLCHKSLQALDAVSLGDMLLVSKVVLLDDGVVAVEMVDRWGAVKTRLFLLFGDLAIQLTGN